MADRGPQRVCRRLRCKDEERVALAVCLEAILRKCCERRIGQRLPKFVNRNHHALACQERVYPLEQVEHDRRADFRVFEEVGHIEAHETGFERHGIFLLIENPRSEERRLGKEGVSTLRALWMTYP